MLQQRSTNTARKPGKPFSLPAVQEAGSRALASGKTIIAALGLSVPAPAWVCDASWPRPTLEPRFRDEPGLSCISGQVSQRLARPSLPTGRGQAGAVPGTHTWPAWLCVWGQADRCWGALWGTDPPCGVDTWVGPLSSRRTPAWTRVSWVPTSAGVGNLIPVSGPLIKGTEVCGKAEL